MKKLASWLQDNSLTQADLARIIRRNPVRAHRIMNGSIPNAREMKLIFKATKGEITANDFYDLPSSGAAHG